MNKIRSIINQKKYFFLILFIVEALFCVIYLSVFGNKPQIYKDIVVEYTSAFLSNKTAELHLTYWMIFIATILYTLYFFLTKQYRKTDLMDDFNEERCLIGVFIVIFGISYLMFSQIDSILICFCLYLLSILLIKKADLKKGVIFFWLIHYALCAIYRIYVVCGGTEEMNIHLLNIATLILSFLSFSWHHKKKMNLYISFFLQILISGLWLIFLQSLYQQTEGEGENLIYNTIQPNKIVYIFVICAILLCILDVFYFYFIKMDENPNLDIKETITVGTGVSIMMFNQFFGTGAVMSADMRHPYENIIGFSQIFRLNQIPFEEYIPVSGMYSVVHGAFFQLFGKGRFSDYNISTNIFYAFIIFCTIFLLSKHIDRLYVFIFSVCISFTDYNRTLFVIPIMLLLTMPKLLKKHNLWLKIWILSSLFLGLYYPILGVAVCISFIPMATTKIVEYVKSGGLKKDAKTVGFYIFWILTLLPVFFAGSWLIGLARHTLTMSGQSIYADGLARFGQTIPDSFFSYLNSDSARLILYLLFSFMLPVFMVFLSYYFMLENVRDTSNKTVKYHLNIHTEAAAMIISVAIMMSISFSYTCIRMDVNNLYSRHLGIVTAGAVIIAVYALGGYIQDIKIKQSAIIIAFGVIASTSVIGFEGNNWKLRPYYIVPEEYTYINTNEIPNLGEGYYKKEIYDAMLGYRECALNYENQYGFYTQFGPPYLYDVKGLAAIEIRTVRGYEATRETLQIIKEKWPVIGPKINSLDNYYLYHWLLTSGNYSYSEEGVYIPNKQPLTFEEIAEINKAAGFQSNVKEIGNHAAALGASMKDLKKIFSDVKTDYRIEEAGEITELIFDKPLLGENADFLYIQFCDEYPQTDYALYNTSKGFIIQENADELEKHLLKKIYNDGKTVTIRWNVNDQDCSIKCNMNNGKLLIPLGSGKNWLLYNHENIKIMVNYNGSLMPVPPISELNFLKLREVE